MKIRIIKEWPDGIPRDTIAENYNISPASVTNILSQARNGEIRDIDLLREVGLVLKRKRELEIFCTRN